MAISMRPAQAIRLWHEVALALVLAGEDELSVRQVAILLTVYLEPPPHTVRGLAAKLGVTKPVITRALDTMGSKGLLTRRRDTADKRNVIVQRTVEGAMFLERLGEMISDKGRQVPK